MSVPAEQTWGEVAEAIDQGVRLHDTPWADFAAFLAARGDQSDVRVTPERVSARRFIRPRRGAC